MVNARHNLSRPVFGVLGVPLDALDFPALIAAIRAAANDEKPFLISTPNVNFLINSRNDQAFRASLLASALCTADGMPLVLIARALGVPIGARLSGSDTFDELRADVTGRPLKVFFFGSTEEVAAKVSKSLDAEAGGLRCVGVLCPGFGSVADMSADHLLETINASGADLLAVFLSASKAQSWLLRNHDRLRVPVRLQFGATINFQAGIVKRAPPWVRGIGCEWLWRIKEEPYLWRRYWSDGRSLLKIVLTSALPVVIGNFWRRFRSPQALLVARSDDPFAVTIKLKGDAVAAHVDRAILIFEGTLCAKKPILVDLAETRAIDPRFFGLFLLLSQHTALHGISLKFVGISRSVKRAFQLNGFAFLLNTDTHEISGAQVNPASSR
jgi:N-acetylglucosaminyldiphosphoundecaprenol N-acetyl-beta-D-mannosaminyltransferase